VPGVLNGLGNEFLDVGNDDVFPLSCVSLLATCGPA
jgi:hypothetical protein